MSAFCDYLYSRRFTFVETWLLFFLGAALARSDWEVVAADACLLLACSVCGAIHRAKREEA